MKCLICKSVQLNILCPVCISRQYPQHSSNLTMMHEFCSIFIRNTVKQGRSLTHMVCPDEIQHVRQRVSVCRANAEEKKTFSQSIRPVVSVTVSKLGKTDLVFVQPGAKINSVYYCENVLKPCSATSNNMKLVHWPLMGAVTFHTVRRGLGGASAHPVSSSLYQM